MNDKQIVEYCKKLILANLHQYAEQDPGTILNEIYSIEDDETNKILLAHLKGVKELLEKGIKILERKNKNEEN